MTTKHTPGPWIAKEVMVEGYTGYDITCSKTNQWIASVHSHQADMADYCEANANLISVSADLLDLVSTANHSAFGSHTSFWQEKARAALAKATGSTE